MTNPNTGAPVPMLMPEVLEGGDPFAAEIATFDESTSPAELSRMVGRLCGELDRTSAYGRALWTQLEEVATYLRENIAHAAGTTDGGQVLIDDGQRRRWADVYGATLSLLAGTRGDSGYGRAQAQLEVQNLER